MKKTIYPTTKALAIFIESLTTQLTISQVELTWEWNGFDEIVVTKDGKDLIQIKYMGVMVSCSTLSFCKDLSYKEVLEIVKRSK
jgi:hypothetical protein